MKILLVVLFCIFSFGCGDKNYNNSKLEELDELEEVCYKGNRYIKLQQSDFKYSLTPLFHSNGTPISCEVGGNH